MYSKYKNILILGLGSIGNRHLSILIKNKSLFKIKNIYCYDVNQKRRETTKKKYKEEIIVPDIIKNIRTKIDLTYICVPTAFHINVFREIIEYFNCDFFIEKPITSNLKDAEEIVSKLDSLNKNCFVGYMLRFHPVIKKLNSLINSKEVLGKIFSLKCEAGFYLPYWHPWEDYRKFYMSWKHGGGGALLDISHEIDYLYCVFGEINQVKGYIGNVSNLEITSDDICNAIFKFNSGIIGHLHLDLLQHNEARELKVIGSKGILKLDLMKNQISIYTNKSKKEKLIKFKVDFNNIYFEQTQNLLNPSKQHNLVKGHFALKTMNFIEGLIKSNNSNTTSNLPLY